jgi:N-formylglutamate amidohydrolase
VDHPAADKVYHTSCHCMSAIGAPTHPDAGQERADFCLGNIHLGQSTSSTGFVEFVAKTIRDQGFTCTINMPYDGGETNRRYGDPPPLVVTKDRTVRNIHG